MEADSKENEPQVKEKKKDELVQIDDDLVYEYYKLDTDICKSRANRNCSNNARCLKGLGQSNWHTHPENLRSTSNLFEKQQFDYRGLNNLGATCYLNSFLQLWFHNVTLRKAIYEWRPNSGQDTSAEDNAITCLQLVLAMMQFGPTSVVDPTPVVKSLNLDKSQEQDVHEFSSLFMSYLSNKLDFMIDKSIQQQFSQQYCLKLRHTIRCFVCDSVSEQLSDHNELFLPVKGFKDIYECIRNYLKVETLEGYNEYSCVNCRKMCKASRSCDIIRLPPVLHLQLMRFESSNGMNRKISSFLKFPTKLDMSEFVKDSPLGSSNNMYELSAILIHEGQTAYSGHYITFIKKKNDWYKFNDELVEKLKQLNLKNDDIFQNVGGKKSEKGFHHSKNAYMLVYRKESDPDLELPDSPEQCNLPDYVKDYLENHINNYFQETTEMLNQQKRRLAYEREHQERVSSLYSEMEVPRFHERFDAICKTWLINFFKSETPEDVPLVDNEILLCSHKKLHIDAPFKCITKESADKIYETYPSNIRIKLPEGFCFECIRYRIEMNRIRPIVENDQKEISNLLKFKNFQDEKQYVVGKTSFRNWKAIKFNMIKKRFHLDYDKELLNFNQDLICSHGALTADKTIKRLVRKDVWEKLHGHFPRSQEFTEDDPPCADCLKIEQAMQNTRDLYTKEAATQRSQLIDLYNVDAHIYWSDLKPRENYYAISANFYKNWRKFIANPCNSVPPQSLSQFEKDILCSAHQKFIFPPYRDEFVGCDKSYLILNQNQWFILKGFYSYSNPILITDEDSSDRNFQTRPRYCPECHDNYLLEQRRSRLNYSGVPIYVRKEIFDDSETNDENDEENHGKKRRTDDGRSELGVSITKRSLRRRRRSDQMEIIVSSDDQLKNIKNKIMQEFKIATFDQVLYYNKELLTSGHNSLTLSQLGIEPLSTLKLKIEESMDQDASGDEIPLEVGVFVPEAGFKGTQLQLS